MGQNEIEGRKVVEVVAKFKNKIRKVTEDKGKQQQGINFKTDFIFLPNNKETGESKEAR